MNDDFDRRVGLPERPSWPVALLIVLATAGAAGLAFGLLLVAAVAVLTP
jgi:hypothetical protein